VSLAWHPFSVFNLSFSSLSFVLGRQRESRLYSEISDLESRLAAVRKEGASAAKERDALKTLLKKEERDIMAASRKELSSAKRAAAQEKKQLSRDRWALESKIQQAALKLAPALEELEDVKRRYNPLEISSLKDSLTKMKNKTAARVEALQNSRVANEISFGDQLKLVKEEKLLELDLVKSTYEAEISQEERALENATSYFNMELKAKENELLRNSKLASIPVEYAGIDVIEDAKKKLAALWDNTQQSISNAKEDRDNEMANAVEEYAAIKDRYDAEYENALRNLDAQKSRGEIRLKQEDKRRERRRSQLEREMRDVKRKLTRLMQDEKMEAEKNYKYIKQTKTTELDINASQIRRAKNEIGIVQSDLFVVNYEMNNLEKELQQQQCRLSELEEERSSFRKQARRTLSTAFGRITRRGSGAREN